MSLTSNWNNMVRDARGRTVGFKCSECGGIFESMWGNACNGCRDAERRHREALRALRELTAAIEAGRQQ